MDLKWMWLFVDSAAPAGRAWEFWRAVAAGRLSPTRGEREQFTTVLPVTGDPWLKLQAVESGGGVHLDLDVEDVDGATRFAAGLGAREVHRYPDGTVVVMRSPGGFVFCLTRWHGETSQVRTGATELVDQVCLDIPPELLDVEAGFWSRLLDIPVAPSIQPEFQLLPRPADLPVQILLQRLDAGDGPVRGHPDLACVDRAAAAERHVTLGASLVREHPWWTVLTDPAGMAYCLTDRHPVTGRRPDR